MLTALILATAFQAAAATEPTPIPPAAPAREVAHNVYLLPGDFAPGRGPDGNTVVFRNGSGLIVVDTGRHVVHSDAILAFATAQRKPIRAIVNTHWHLDHSSGNWRIKAVYPRAQIYTTSAIDRAMADGGFLANSLDQANTRLAEATDPTEREETTLFIETMSHREMLRPDVPLTTSRRMSIGGKTFDVHVSNHAVTDADVWLYDRSTHIAVVGDLVTLPAPFFETACPREWSEELDAVWATPFTMAIPGHGEPMTRATFDTYRTAFNAFMACANSERAASECGTVWAEGVATIEPDNGRLHRNAAAFGEYYTGFLREHGGKPEQCQLER